MKLSKPSLIIAVAALVGSGIVYVALKYQYVKPGALGSVPSASVSLYRYNPSIAQDAKDLYQNQDALYSYVKKFGPKKTIAHLVQLSATYGSCHDTAHRAGRMTYELLGSQAFQQCAAECHSGCYHGATEAFFHEHGTANLADNLKVICSSAENAFFSHQCIHGIGHGLMAWTSYDLFDALKSCDLLSQRQDSCWTGVFMENIVGGLANADIEKKPEEIAHFTKYLSDDPLYPCSDPTLDSKYISSCYFLQTSRMLQIFGTNWDKVAAACSAAPSQYQRSCFESMGRDVGGTNARDEAGAIQSCQFAPAGGMRIGCLIGAAQDAFWDPAGQDHAIRFCTLLKDPKEKSACYDIIFGRAPDVLASSAQLEKFCAKVEPDFRDRCSSYIR